MSVEKKCKKCKEDKDTSEFYKDLSRKDNLRSECIDCTKNSRGGCRRNKRRDRLTVTDRKEYYKVYYRELKLATIQHYSHGTNKCGCCGESHFEFLSLDHINGGGHKHRKSLKYKNLYRHLKQNNWPDGYRILCMNCNFAIGKYGDCPHSKE